MNLRSLRGLCVGLLFGLFSGSVRAEFHLLYETETRSVPGYAKIVQELKKGDVIQFGDGRRFTIMTEPARSGMLDVIFKVEEGFALRVPRYVDSKVISVDASYHAYKTLKESGVKVIEMIDGAYRPHQYLGVEWSEFKYYYFDLIKNKTIPAELREKMLDDLVEFARSTWNFRNIGDLREEQIVYDEKRGWLILDALDEHSVVQFADQGTIYTPDVIEVMRNQAAVKNGDLINAYGEKLRFPKDKGWTSKLLKAIEQERLAHGMKYGPCRQLIEKARNWFKSLY